MSLRVPSPAWSLGADEPTPTPTPLALARDVDADGVAFTLLNSRAASSAQLSADPRLGTASVR